MLPHTVQKLLVLEVYDLTDETEQRIMDFQGKNRITSNSDFADAEFNSSAKGPYLLSCCLFNPPYLNFLESFFK